MKTRLSLVLIASAIAGLFCLQPSVVARNPVVQTCFTADPAPMVHNGTLYLYTSHDEDDAPPGMGAFRMKDWKCYTTTDMVNWTDHGTIASLATFPWADQMNDAWAPQVVERNGKFYLYAPVGLNGWPKNVIGVAVSDSPLGPFKDALGHPLVGPVTGYIDPTVLIDDDGQAYMYFGNPNLWYVKLNEDMVSYSGEIVQEPTKPDNYQEGPWFYKRNGHYYIAYASSCCPEGIGYAMSDKPTGPWTYEGYVMRPNAASSGNHPGIIAYKGRNYVFGFNYKLNFALTDEHHERRSVCVSEFDYNPDGTIKEVPWWDDAGVQQVDTLNPYRRVEAETICWSEGVQSGRSQDGGIDIRFTREGSYTMVKGVDFREGAQSFSARVASEFGNARIEIHLDSVDGPLAGTCAVGDTNGLREWTTKFCVVRGVSGVHDLYLIFKGDEKPFLVNFDWWCFIPLVAGAR